MVNTDDTGRHLLPLALGSVVGAISLAAGAAALPASLTLATAQIVAQLVAGLSINYASGSIGPVLGSLRGHESPGTNHDLDRVARHALLTILYEVLTERGLSSSQSARAVQAAARVWDLRVFAEGDFDKDELLQLLRIPRPLDEARGLQVARQILRDEHTESRTAYAQAIVARFARTIEVLLRSDERAYRAATIYLQRLTLDDLRHVREDLAPAIDLLLRPQPTLERFEALRKDVDDSSVRITDLLQAPCDSVPVAPGRSRTD